MCIGASQVGVGGSLLSPQPAQSRWFFSRQRTHDAKAGSSKEAACFSKTWCSCKGDVLQSTHVALLSSTEARDRMRVLFSGPQGLPFQPSNKSEAGNGISWEVWVQKRFVWNVTFYLALLGGWGVSRPLGSTAGPSPSAYLRPSHVPLHGFQRRQKPHIKILDPRVPGCFLASGALWTFLLLRHISCVCVCVCVCVCETEKQTDRIILGEGPVVVNVTSFSSIQFSRSVMSDSLQPHEPQHTRPPCPSPTPRVHPNSCPLSRWCHPAISSSVIPFSSCPQSLPASESFQMSQLFASGGQSIGVSASASVLPLNTQDLSPLGWTGWISLQSKGLSRVFSSTIVQKHQFFGTQLSSQSNSPIHTWPQEKP